MQQAAIAAGEFIGKSLGPLEVAGARMAGKAIENVLTAPNTAEDSKPDLDLNARLLGELHRLDKDSVRP